MASPLVVPTEQFVESSFVDICRSSPHLLVYFLLNIGDGDTQFILLPADQSRKRSGIIVDIGSTRKLPALIDALAEAKLLEKRPDLFPLVVATHPHDDHIGGLPEFIERFGSFIREYWDPGYYHPNASFIETMHTLETMSHIQITHPTSGMTRYLYKVRLTVLSPGVVLRNRFDTYGTTINDASLTLKLDYPGARVYRDGENRRYAQVRDPWSLILGADAQTTAWAQATVDFPELQRGENLELYAELRHVLGRDLLKADVIKVPHHASKRGVNLELIERIAPSFALISCSSGGRYGFPHQLALEIVREARQPVMTTGLERREDYLLGLHTTCAVDSAEVPLGSIAMAFSPKRGEAPRLWRFGDLPKKPVELSQAREFIRDGSA